VLKLQISGDVEAFRGEFRRWLATHRAPDMGADAGLDTFVRVGREWQQTLAEGNWVGVHWPREYGGRSCSLVEEAVVQEELVRARSPQLLGLFGLTMVGPVLIRYGTPAQKERFLAPILRAQEIWCQGFSEPGAGSDLAAIKTRARVTPEGYYITGQKIWTSFAHIADWCFVLCRTAPESERHQGLSYLLVDMKSKGISTRPLQQISGDKEFNEVFFDEVFVPADRIVGAPGDGWKIAISTLMYERVVLTFARQLQSEVALRGLIDRPEAKGSAAVGSELSREIARACGVRALAYDHLLSYANGASPGPEGSLDKLLWSESFQSIAKTALRLDGVEGALREDDPSRGIHAVGRSRLVRQRFNGRSSLNVCWGFPGYVTRSSIDALLHLGRSNGGL
jgi:alkylation response protein AidB-like acyl-CoA dehydrogenase